MNNKRHTHSKIEHKEGRVIELNEEFKDLFSIHNLDIEENELFSFLSEEVIQDIEETLKKDGDVVTSMTKINTDSLQDSNYEKSKMLF